jgi:predicted phage terminase large subunit-like protein
MEYPDLKSNVVNHADEWNPTAILIEDKASGQSLLQDLGRETRLPLVAFQPQGDKIMRASAVSATVEAGKVFLPQHAVWLTDYEMELMTFPNSVHYDQVDSTTQFLSWVRDKSHAPQLRIRRL